MTRSKTTRPEAVAMPEPRSADGWDKLSDEERMLKVAEANIRMYGSLTPPVEVQAQSLTKRCANCSKVGVVSDLFGTFKSKGRTYFYSWCRECRGSRDAHPTRYGLTGKRAAKAKPTSKTAGLTAAEEAQLKALLAKMK